jgi:hypothetical protein
MTIIIGNRSRNNVLLHINYTESWFDTISCPTSHTMWGLIGPNKMILLLSIRTHRDDHVLLYNDDDPKIYYVSNYRFLTPLLLALSLCVYLCYGPAHNRAPSRVWYIRFKCVYTKRNYCSACNGPPHNVSIYNVIYFPIAWKIFETVMYEKWSSLCAFHNHV